MKFLRYYSPFRIWLVFHFLLTLFLVIKRREKLLFLKPLSPKGLHDTIVLLGASFIKLAQVLATRADFFTPEYLDALKSLHDELPPMSEYEFNLVYNRAFGDRKIFKSFDNEPIAAASIGQVHVAYLKDNTKVAVKLRREGIYQRVKADIRILSFFNKLFQLIKYCSIIRVIFRLVNSPRVVWMGYPKLRSIEESSGKSSFPSSIAILWHFIMRSYLNPWGV